MAKELLTKEDYLKILLDRFKAQNIEFKKAKWAPLFNNAEGYMGDHYVLTLTYKLGKIADTERFFIKTKSDKNEAQNQLTSDFMAYEKEIFLYDFLFKEFEKLGFYTSFAPKSYLCKNMKTIVLEDLKIKDYSLKDRKEPFDLDHCRIALRALAHFHANSIAYEEMKSAELRRTYRLNEENPSMYKELLFIPNNPDADGTRYFKSTVDCFLNVCDHMLEPEEWKTVFRAKIKNFDFAKTFWQHLPTRKTLTHGDLWNNNMLFQYCNDVPTSCCLVDYQMLRHHHPAYDVLLLLNSTTRRDFRKKYSAELIKYYYDSFEEILKDNGYEAKSIFSWGDFLKTAKCLGPVALMQGASTRTITLLPAEITNEAAKSEGDALKAIWFTARPRLIEEACKKDEELKRIIEDDVYDLYEQI